MISSRSPFVRLLRGAEGGIITTSRRFKSMTPQTIVNGSSVLDSMSCNHSFTSTLLNGTTNERANRKDFKEREKIKIAKGMFDVQVLH
jgi:hypothetical protein